MRCFLDSKNGETKEMPGMFKLQLAKKGEKMKYKIGDRVLVKATIEMVMQDKEGFSYSVKIPGSYFPHNVTEIAITDVVTEAITNEPN